MSVNFSIFQSEYLSFSSSSLKLTKSSGTSTKSTVVWPHPSYVSLKVIKAPDGYQLLDKNIGGVCVGIVNNELTHYDIDIALELERNKHLEFYRIHDLIK